MARDRLLTTHKLNRVDGAIDDLLECADVQFVAVLRAAQRAVAALRGWHEAELAAGGRADEAEDVRELDAIDADRPASPAAQESA